jgi:hypothetical protein
MTARGDLGSSFKPSESVNHFKAQVRRNDKNFKFTALANCARFPRGVLRLLEHA